MAFCNYTHMHGPTVNVTHVSLLLMPLHLLSSPQKFSFFSLLFSFSGLTLHCSFFLLLLLLFFSSSFTFSILRCTILSFLFSSYFWTMLHCSFFPLLIFFPSSFTFSSLRCTVLSFFFSFFFLLFFFFFFFGSSS